MRWGLPGSLCGAAKSLIVMTYISNYSISYDALEAMGRERMWPVLAGKMAVQNLVSAAKINRPQNPVDICAEKATLPAMIRTANIARWYFTLLP
ncbi:hypothetical protein ASD32_04775 [Rhizobium sp. Root483D2]|nr:hypothetical protein ASD32_04775 [Rhizobium sp. Root483D2]